MNFAATRIKLFPQRTETCCSSNTNGAMLMHTQPLDSYLQHYKYNSTNKK